MFDRLLAITEFLGGKKTNFAMSFSNKQLSCALMFEAHQTPLLVNTSLLLSITQVEHVCSLETSSRYTRQRKRYNSSLKAKY